MRVQSTAFKTTKSEWTDQDEAAYGEFVKKIGYSKCGSVTECLKSSANPYRDSDPSNLKFYSDCGKFPYILRGYYAWKKGLPFSYVDEVKAVGGKGNDDRYSPDGNLVASRFTASGLSPALPVDKVIGRVTSTVHSGMYRMGPESNTTPGKFTDTYPVSKIDRNSVRPGSNFYDINGHVLVVYDVTPDGKVLFVDSHPDNTLSRKTFNSDAFPRSRPLAGGGFRNWRPTHMVGSTKAEDGTLVGGSVAGTPDADLPDGHGNNEQYFGNGAPTKDHKKAEFIHDGSKVGFDDFVRNRLASAPLKIDPIAEFKTEIANVCSFIQQRVEAVKLATDGGMDKKPHPDTLPQNIYGAEGDWEVYATPSRDLNLRRAFKHLQDVAVQYLRWQKQKNPSLVYSGKNLLGELTELYRKESASCVVPYVNSAGKKVEMSMKDFPKRLEKISYDPYDCVELRWGAISDAELASCPQFKDPTKMAWYKAQQNLRNNLEKDTNAKMGYSLNDLQSKAPSTGPAALPDLDLANFFANPSAIAKEVNAQ